MPKISARLSNRGICCHGDMVEVAWNKSIAPSRAIRFVSEIISRATHDRFEKIWDLTTYTVGLQICSVH